jgi:hypothetical protein
MAVLRKHTHAYLLLNSSFIIFRAKPMTTKKMMIAQMVVMMLMVISPAQIIEPSGLRLLS